jgi:polyvinyl alcohol dehydrogenase (cytochrome)
MIVAALVTASCSSSNPEPDGATRADDETAAQASADEWLHLGQDLGSTRAASDTTIGADTVEELEPAWELEDVNGVSGTPIVVEGTLYVGDWTGHVRALDTASGEERWATDVETRYVGGAVAVDDERVFVGTWSSHVVALDRETGDEVWDTSTGDHPNTAIFGSPIHVDGLVLVGAASYEEFTAGEGAPPTFRGYVVALDAATGDEVWRYWTTPGDETAGPGVPVWSSPSVDTEREHVYIATGNNYAPPSSDNADAVIALDLRTGEEIWVNQFTGGDTWTLAEPLGPDADIGGVPNLFAVDGTDAVGVGDKAGVYRALDRDSGEELWSAELTEGGLQGGVLASAAVDDESVYVASNKASTTADLIALESASGAERWRVEVGGSVAGPVTWANGVVYVADDSGHISAFADEDGQRLWSHEVDAQAAGGIAVVDGTVYGGWGWWLAGAPEDPQGGLIAFRLPGSGSGGGSGDEATSADAEASGEDVYQRSCANCHGGSGEGASGPSLVGVDERLSRADHLEIVREGRGEMPGWEGDLTPEEIEAVVDYERSELASGD